MNPTPDTTNATETEEAARIRLLEREKRVLGSELESSRHATDVAQEQERRALYRAEGLVRALDVVARALDEAEREHDDTISALRQAEHSLRGYEERIEGLEAYVRLELRIFELEHDDEEPF